MSVTVVNEWRFLEGADLDEAMRAVRQYMTYLDEGDTGLEQSLWLRDTDDPLHHYHIATYRSLEALEAQWSSAGTARFVERLYPLIDDDSVAQPTGEVVANTGTGPGEV